MSVAAAPAAGAGPLDLELGEVLAGRRRVFASGRTRGLEWRRDQLRGVVRLLDDNELEIAAALAADLGRPPVEAWLGDVAPPRGEAVYALGHLDRWTRPVRTWLPMAQQPATGRVRYEPLGTVLLLSPWNYPVHLALAPLVGALAAGNCAVVKPSERAPASSALLARLLPRYVDPQAVVVVEGDADVSRALVAQGFDHVLFTGGGDVARQVLAQAAGTLTPVTLELGGKNPVVVAADADVRVAARRIAWVKTMNAGQTCVAPDYVLVDRRVREPLLAALADAMTSFCADRPAGLPVLDRRQAERLDGWLRGTRGTVVSGGGTDPATGLVRPTVVLDPGPDEPLLTEEIFGPVLPVRTVDGVDEAVAFVRDRPKPLAAYVFTDSRSLGRRLADELPAGAVVVNHVALHCLLPQLPFGGVGASGTGAYHGEWGFRRFSHAKAVLARRARPDPALLYPPYTDRAVALMRRFF